MVSIDCLGSLLDFDLALLMDLVANNLHLEAENAYRPPKEVRLRIADCLERIDEGAEHIAVLESEAVAFGAMANAFADGAEDGGECCLDEGLYCLKCHYLVISIADGAGQRGRNFESAAASCCGLVLRVDMSDFLDFGDGSCFHSCMEPLACLTSDYEVNS